MTPVASFSSLPVLNELVTKVRWRPEIGDPDLLSWTITISHLVAGLICLRIGFQRSQGTPLKGQSALQWVWLMLGFSLIFFGLNKQLDLQILLTEVGRILARDAGFFEKRKTIQAIFVAVFATASTIFVFGQLYFTRHRLHEFGFALLGMMCLVAFAIIRAATFYHLERYVNRLPFNGSYLNAALELGGSLLVSLGAVLALRRTANGSNAPSTATAR